MYILNQDVEMINFLSKLVVVKAKQSKTLAYFVERRTWVNIYTHCGGLIVVWLKKYILYEYYVYEICINIEIG